MLSDLLWLLLFLCTFTLNFVLAIIQANKSNGERMDENEEKMAKLWLRKKMKPRHVLWGCGMLIVQHFQEKAKAMARAVGA